MGRAEAGPGSGVEPGEADQRSYLPLHGCLAVVAVAVFLVVFAPLLIWAAAIIFAGGR